MMAQWTLFQCPGRSSAGLHGNGRHEPLADPEADGNGAAIATAPGAKVRIGKQFGYATTSGSYLSASDARLHFGLGAEKSVHVEILWPSGRRQVLENVAADQILEISEPQQ